MYTEPISLANQPSYQARDYGNFSKQYIIKGMLGKGGFGAVNAGERVADKKSVAIKYVDKKRSITTPGGDLSQPLEVTLMEMVSSPRRCENVVEFLDWFQTPTENIYVLERPSHCMNLQEFLTKYNNGKLAETSARKVMWQVVRAARHCMDCNVFHRDIKAENLLINPGTLEVKLIDFGCGDLLKNEPYTSYAGTPCFQPPEWLIHRTYLGHPATVWSLGVLLFHLVCGEYPFKSEEERTVAQLLFPPALSGDCCALISWCLKKDPEDRLTLNQILSHMWFNP